jgi:hypothetical protein
MTSATTLLTNSSSSVTWWTEAITIFAESDIFLKSSCPSARIVAYSLSAHCLNCATSPAQHAVELGPFYSPPRQSNVIIEISYPFTIYSLTSGRLATFVEAKMFFGLSRMLLPTMYLNRAPGKGCFTLLPSRQIKGSFKACLFVFTGFSEKGMVLQERLLLLPKSLGTTK